MFGSPGAQGPITGPPNLNRLGQQLVLLSAVAQAAVLSFHGYYECHG